MVSAVMRKTIIVVKVLQTVCYVRYCTCSAQFCTDSVIPSTLLCVCDRQKEQRVHSQHEKRSVYLSNRARLPLYLSFLCPMTHSCYHASKPLTHSCHIFCSTSFSLSVCCFFINSRYSRLLMLILPLLSVSLKAFFSLSSPGFCRPRGTRSAISKQFITCSMLRVQYPSPHCNATAAITHTFCPSRSLSLLSQMQQNEFFCLKGYVPRQHTLTHIQTRAITFKTESSFCFYYIDCISLFITSYIYRVHALYSLRIWLKERNHVW